MLLSIACLLAAIAGVGVLYAWWILRTTTTDKTDTIRPLCGVTYACERPLFLTEADGQVMLETGLHIDNYPKSMEDYRRHEIAWPIRITDALEPGTLFRIERMALRKSAFNSDGYYLTATVLSGTHSGQHFEVFATDVMKQDSSGKWALELFIRPASATTKPGGG